MQPYALYPEAPWKRWLLEELNITWITQSFFPCTFLIPLQTYCHIGPVLLIGGHTKYFVLCGLGIPSIRSLWGAVQTGKCTCCNNGIIEKIGTHIAELLALHFLGGGAELFF